ncbi:helix-turn-helix domain-containing protein [Modestobacter sp. VKM Ac-2985]|uniref:helix-turn-helix domain-containing protein n=1 Tax=Modestobacter sp. VKM Ac-2985 TaxID=3004139 RepID=UPI0022ABA7BD|nr:helix-turn-helix domain-containing protein [Modestobacter sp. VKM Ac-2985]MCZ2838853.1 helix-turn-helix domain-containing protein [Modestobacter sp. VKM Ac-2985]
MDDARLTRIEERLAALEARLETAPAGVPTPERFWLLQALAAEAAELPGGAVAYGGQVRLPGGEEYAWQRTHDVEELRTADPADDDVLATSLSALAHPVRLRLLREVLGGTTTTAALAALPGLGTTGQLHHHLRQLTSAGWLRTTGRGAYGVPAERVVPLLVVLAAVSS